MRTRNVLKVLALSPLLFLLGCASSSPTLLPGAADVLLLDDEPGAGMESLGPIQATNGAGCGVFGQRGDALGAEFEIRNAAARVGADAVWIVRRVPPHTTPGCAVNEYTIEGIAYRRLESATDAQLAEVSTVIEHEFSQQDAFAKLNRWVAETYVSANDVIQLADASSGTLVVKGAYRPSENSETARYRMSIDVREGRVRFRQQIEDGATARLAEATLAHFEALRSDAIRALNEDDDF